MEGLAELRAREEKLAREWRGLHDHDLMAGEEEPVFSQLRNLSEKKRRKLVQLRRSCHVF
jgi:hypothetical protein